MKIYFAASIRGGRDDKEIYLAIVNLLKKYGEVLTEHIGNQELSVTGENELSDEYIYNRDMRWLNNSDVIIAEVTTPSLGIGYEIAKMEGKKPVLCLFRERNGAKLSAMIGGNKMIRIERYKSMSEVERILEEFFKDIK